MLQKIHQRVWPRTGQSRTLSLALLRSRILWTSCSRRVTLWPWRIRRNPPRRHLRVVRFTRRGGTGRRFALHHLRKKIPRRRTLSRRATIRTARHMSRLSFSEMKQDIFTKSTLVHLQFGGGLIPLRALCGKDALRGRAPWRRFLPSFGNPRFQVFRGGPFPSLGRGDSRFFSPIILLRGDTNSPSLDE